MFFLLLAVFIYFGVQGYRYLVRVIYHHRIEWRNSIIFTEFLKCLFVCLMVGWIQFDMESLPITESKDFPITYC